MCEKKARLNLDEPRYDEETYIGRLQRCFQAANPLNLFTSALKLEEARCLVLKYKCNEPLPEAYTESEIWAAKQLYESAYSPETGDRLPLLARPGFRIPAQMVLLGGMLAFYNSTPGTVLWQWAHQTYIALRSLARKDGTNSQIATGYVAGTGTATGTALVLNKLLKTAHPLVRRMVPLVAVAAANCARVPLLKAQDIKNGIPVFDDWVCKLGHSKNAAQKSISEEIVQKNIVLVPGMILTPVMLDYLETRGSFCRYRWMHYTSAMGLLGLCLLFVTPFGCALFKKMGQIPYAHLDPELREFLDKRYKCNYPRYVFYNK